MHRCLAQYAGIAVFFGIVPPAKSVAKDGNRKSPRQYEGYRQSQNLGH
jgi:hypothetical protein